MTDPDDDPLLTLRAAFILPLGVLVGVAVGTVTYLGSSSLVTAVLAGLPAAGATIVAAPKLIA